MATRRAPLLTQIGRRLRELREARGLTQRTLSAEAGLSTRFVAQLEAGEGNVSVLRLSALAQALGSSLADLLADAEAHLDVGKGARIALLGLRGAGKSTIGAKLAKRLGVPFFELDGLIEKAAGLPLAQIFELHGEAYYRRLERETLTQLVAEHRGAILATGGSLVTSPPTYRVLRRHFLTVWLKARADDHWNRVVEQGDMRPMAQSPHAMAEMRALLAARESLYAQAQLVVDTSRLGIAGAVETIRKEFPNA